MSLSEEQICKIVHRELKRIIDTGLMYTEEVDKQAPSAQPQQAPAQAQPTPKQAQVKAINDQGVHWTQMAATDKGPWEKTTESSPQLLTIEDAIHNKGKPQFVDGALYWILQDRESGQDIGVGRRRKQ